MLARRERQRELGKKTGAGRVRPRLVGKCALLTVADTGASPLPASLFGHHFVVGVRFGFFIK